MITSKEHSPKAIFQRRQARQRRRQQIVTIAAFLILVSAWLIGYFSVENDGSAAVFDVLPGIQRVESRDNGLFVGYGADATGHEIVVGYAMPGSATGYGGPLTLMVGTDPSGSIVGVQVVANRETPNFFHQLDIHNYYDQFTGKDYSNQFSLGGDVDGISGATLSSEAVAQSIRNAVRGIASKAIEGAEIPPLQQNVNFGLPEVTLIALFVVSFFLHRLKKQPSLKKYGRWAVLLTGMVVLGFVLNKPFTLANVITFLSGYWPDWHNNLYWFLLLGGIFLVTTIQGKNPYCSWFCPFGATQEILGSLTGAKLYQPRSLYGRLRWLQRALSFFAIVLGLALRQPGAASYEPFGTLFDLTGSWPQWLLLGLVLFGSLVVYRPFCNYICPLDPVVGYIGELRRIGKSLWRQRSRVAVSTSDNPS